MVDSISFEVCLILNIIQFDQNWCTLKAIIQRYKTVDQHQFCAKSFPLRSYV